MGGKGVAVCLTVTASPDSIAATKLLAREGRGSLQLCFAGSVRLKDKKADRHAKEARDDEIDRADVPAEHAI